MSNINAIVIMSEQHKLLPVQTRLLDSEFGSDTFGSCGWDILSVPEEGWSLTQILNNIEDLEHLGHHYPVVFVSPIPVMIGKLSIMRGRWDGGPSNIFIFHNDKRISKEFPDEKGGVTIKKVVAPDGWQLVQV